MTASEVKACCAEAYSSDAARFLLGDDFHPGGMTLTDELARELGLRPGALVADVASGVGTSAVRIARSTGCNVVGIELAPDNVARSNARAQELGLLGRVRFVHGDAEALPLEDASVDAVLCECALCLFPDKAAAVREIRRVLRPGARLSLADVTRERDLPAALVSLDAHVACLGGALPLARTVALLREAGLAVESVARRDDAIAPLIERIAARLRLARLLAGGPLAGRVERAEEMLDAARAALRDGTLGYATIVARR